MASLWSFLRTRSCISSGSCLREGAQKSRLRSAFSYVTNRLAKVFAFLVALLVSIMSSTQIAFAAKEYDFPEQVTYIGREITELHHIIFWICMAILAFVTVWMFTSIFLHRKSRGVTPSTFSHSTFLEVLWTIVPVIILVIMAIPATKLLVKMEDTTKSDLTIKATGYQWKWGYEYFDSGLQFYSTISTPREQIESKAPLGENYLQEVDNHVVIPSGKKVRLLLTANDVIHAWWVPQLGGKKDAIPGYINQMWIKVDEGKEGTYRGRCAELCGKDHAYMPIVVDVVPMAEYEKWISANKGLPQGELKNIADLRKTDPSSLVSGELNSIKTAPSTVAN